MQLLKQATPLAVSLAIILIVTAVLYYFNNALHQLGGRLLLTGRAQARCAIRHKLRIQTYKGLGGRQIATSFARAA